MQDLQTKHHILLDLAWPEDEYEYDNEEYNDFEQEDYKDKPSKRSDDYDEFELVDRKKTKERAQSSKPVSKITPMRPSKSKSSSGMEVCVIKPTSIEDAREITETLLQNRTVVLNMEGLDVEIAQRIIDFTSGSCFAISGNLQKISNYIFIITPATVDISGDFQGIMSAFEASSIQTDF